LLKKAKRILFTIAMIFIEMHIVLRSLITPRKIKLSIIRQFSNLKEEVAQAILHCEGRNGEKRTFFLCCFNAHIHADTNLDHCNYHNCFELIYYLLLAIYHIHQIWYYNYFLFPSFKKWVNENGRQILESLSDQIPSNSIFCITRPICLFW